MNEITIFNQSKYKIDFDRIQTVKEVCEILELLQINILYDENNIPEKSQDLIYRKVLIKVKDE